MKRIITALLILVLMLGATGTAAATTQSDINSVYEKTGDYIYKTVKEPVIGTIGGCWAMYGLAKAGYDMGDMPSSDSVWGAVLRQHGFYRSSIPNKCPECYTAEDFAKDNPRGTFVLGFGGHVATIKDGTLFDSWDSSQEIPVYVWYRKD